MGERHDRAEALRLKLASSRDNRKRVPSELREKAVAFAKAAHASGKRYKSIASTLGVKAETLMRWCRASREAKFARVVVKRAARPELIAELHRIEREIDDEPPDGRLRIRQQRAGPVVQQIHR